MASSTSGVLLLGLMLVPIRLLARQAAEPTTEAVDAAAPTAEVAAFYTRPLVRARLRVPQSLQDYTVASITPSRDDSTRFDVEVRFKARTPFGAITSHSARFQMKRAPSTADWIVTAP